MRILRTVEGVNRGMIELTCFHENQVDKKTDQREKNSSSCNEVIFPKFLFWRNVESHPAENVIRRNHQTGKNRTRNRKNTSTLSALWELKCRCFRLKPSNVANKNELNLSILLLVEKVLHEFAVYKTGRCCVFDLQKIRLL